MGMEGEARTVEEYTGEGRVESTGKGNRVDERARKGRWSEGVE